MEESAADNKRALSSDVEEESPAKRRALNSDDDEEEPQSDRHDEQEHDEEEPEDDGASQQNENPSDREDDEEEEAEEAPTFRRTINAPGKPPEAGVILQVHVENFMCHRKFTVDLCRNVNFITGQNGSGKSAILAAIQICLGAGARRTHRARNLKGLVRKDGTANITHAKLRVSLLNCGPDAFQPEVYGDTIMVERNIALTGSDNGYKLLDHRGKVKSKSKKDLDTMLDRLNIQVENPVAVLDQEEAKKFLCGKAEDKYKFFMKATELARISKTHSAIADKLQELVAAKEKIDTAIDAQRHIVKDLRKKYEQHRALEQMEEKHMAAQTSYTWAFYQAVEAEHADAVATLKQYEEKAAKREKEILNAEEQLGHPDDEQASQSQKIAALNQEAEEQAELKNKLEAELRELLAPQKKLQRDKSALKKELKNTEKKLKLYQRRLQEAREEQAGAGGSDEAQRAAVLKEAEDKLAARKGKSNELRQEVSSCLRSYEELEPHVHDAKANAEKAQNQLRGVQGTIQRLSSSSNDSLAVLGPRVRRVFQMVSLFPTVRTDRSFVVGYSTSRVNAFQVEEAAQKRKFRGPVVGPIGHYIKIAPGKEKYAEVAEAAIGTGTLDRFIVTNGADRQALQNIRQQAGCHSDCGIFQIGNNARFRAPKPPVAGIETVESVLKVENDLVYNCLLDNSRIDQFALGTDLESSEELLLYRNERGEDAIRGGNVKNVYLLPKGDHWTVKNGSKAIFTNERKLRKTIGIDKTAALQEAKAEEAHIKEELKQLRKEESRLESEHTQFQRQWNVAKRAMQKNDQEIQNLTTVVEDTRAEIENSANVTVDTSEFEQDVAQTEQEIEELEKDDSKLGEEIEAMEPEIQQVQTRIDECSARNEKVLAELKAADDELTQLLECKTQQEAQLEKKRTKLAKYRAAIETVVEKEKALHADKVDALRKAKTMLYRLNLLQEYNREEKSVEDCQPVLSSTPTEEELDAIEPIEVPKEAGYYEAKMNKWKEKITNEKKRRNVTKEDPAVAYEKWIRAKDDYENKKANSNGIEDMIDSSKNDLDKRDSLWRKLRGYLERNTAMKFDSLLEMNGYEGTVQFDHDSGALDLQVSKESEGGRNKDVKSLRYV